jgi:hypothetical protein
MKDLVRNDAQEWPREIGLAKTLATHWERSPVFCGHIEDPSHRLGIDLAAFTRLLLSGIEMGVKAQYLDQSGEHQELNGLNPAICLQLFRSGMTLCCGYLNKYHDGVRAFMDSFVREIGVLGETLVNAYLSPHAKGFGTHFDKQSSLVIQLCGTKRWRVSDRPACPAPIENCLATALDEHRSRYAREVKRPEDLTCNEYLLEPGDILYVPAGCWHSARAEGESFHLTLSCMSPRIGDDLLRLLRRCLVRDERWRAFVPPTAFGGRRRAHVRDQQRALGSVLGDIAADRVRESEDNARRPGDRDNSRAQSSESGAMLVVPESFWFGVPEPGGSQTVVLAAANGRVIELPPESNDLVAAIAKQKRFTRKDLSSKLADRYSEPDVSDALDFLIDAGILNGSRGAQTPDSPT